MEENSIEIITPVSLSESKAITSQKMPKIKKEKKRRPVLYAILIVILSFTAGLSGSLLGYKFLPKQTVVYTDKNASNIVNTNSVGKSIQDIADTNMKSVVEIMTETTVNSFFNTSTIQTGAGSGVIISEDGHIVTNNHVIEDATNVIVRLSDGSEHIATLVGTDSKFDLAVIKIEHDNLLPAIVGDSDKSRIGDEVVAIGNPLGKFGGSVTDGIISGINREVQLSNHTMSLLQTNAQINPGNSGGGLFDANGNLIGIIVAKSIGKEVEGIGFAIPINDAVDVIDQLITHGYVTNRPTLGISLSEVPYGGMLKAGLYIAEVFEDSAAQQAGLLANDRIIGIDDIEVATYNDLSKYLSSKKVGDTIKMSVVRNDKILVVDVTLKSSKIETE